MPNKELRQDGDENTRMVNSTERETMKRILITIAILASFNSSITKAEMQVIQVRRNIPLSDDEAVYKDYYLSGGSKSGLRVNLVVPVQRWINLRENSQAQDQSMKILEPVGWLKVIFVQDQLAVARLFESVDYSMGPVLEQPGIMMGDIITLDHSYMAKQAQKLPKDSSQVIENQEPEMVKSVHSEPIHQ